MKSLFLNQGVIWPENDDDAKLGSPVIDEEAAFLSNSNGLSDTNDDSTKSNASKLTRSASSVNQYSTTSVSSVFDGKRFYRFTVPLPVTSSRITSNSAVSLSANDCLKASTVDTAVTNGTSKELLSYGMRNALDLASILGILAIPDVEAVLESFRWMSWCALCLHILRIPPATYQLSLLLKVVKKLKIVDDKVVKLISGIYSRAW